MTISEKFMQSKGLSLEGLIPDDHMPQFKIERFINQQIKILETEVRLYNPNFKYADLDGCYKNLFDDILCDQMEYVLHNWDLSKEQGLDLNTGATIPLQELEARTVSPFVKKELVAYGFCYRGLV